MKPSDWKAYNAWKGCIKKVRYQHEGQAKREAHKQNMRAYQCTECKKWHLTSKVKP